MERGDSGRAGLAPELGEGVFQMLANGVLAEAEEGGDFPIATALTPDQKAILASTLAATGNCEAARSPLSTIPANVLPKQEIDLLQTFLD